MKIELLEVFFFNEDMVFLVVFMVILIKLIFLVSFWGIIVVEVLVEWVLVFSEV